MKYFIYAVFDKELSVYDNNIYSYQNDVYVRRFMEDTLRKSQALKSRVSNFAVHKVGEFDTDTGEVKHLVPSVVFELSSLVSE